MLCVIMSMLLDSLLDEVIGLGMLTSSPPPPDDDSESSVSASPRIDTTKALLIETALSSTDASKLTHCLARDIAAFDDLFLTRMADSDASLPAEDSPKNLLRVYYRLMRKHRELTCQLQVCAHPSISCRKYQFDVIYSQALAKQEEGLAVGRAESEQACPLSSAPADTGAEACASECVMPHRLDYEAADMTLAPGGDLPLPLPMPSLPPSDGSNGMVCAVII